MSLLGNVLWVLLGGGLVIFLQYVAAGIGLCTSIIGIPWGLQCFKLAIFGLVPFGQEAVPTGDLAKGPLGVVLNVVWIVLGGVWIALTHLLFALLCAITVIGLPFAVQHWKLAKLALWPFGRDIREIPR